MATRNNSDKCHLRSSKLKLVNPQRVPVSIICVYNNSQVLRDCLEASLHAGLNDAPITEFIAIDNTHGAFPTAGAALNYGASRARNSILVFVHQDVYLHSLPALESAAALLTQDESLGMLGAIGIMPDGGLLGRIRDRVILSGDPLDFPQDVDSVDEVLFMASRQLIESEPLEESPELSWHAYAVEYGVRLRARGLRVAAVTIPLTHNSLTINLDRLTDAHAWIASKYPEAVPVVTTCGVVGSQGISRRALLPFLDKQRWRYRWLRESLYAHRLRRRTGLRTVLADIRFDIDQVCEGAGSGPIRVLNVTNRPSSADADYGRIVLPRLGRSFEFRLVPADRVAECILSYPQNQTVLITGVDMETASSVSALLSGRHALAGFHENTGPWLLIGPAAGNGAGMWNGERATPFAMKPLAGAIAGHGESEQ